MNVCGHVLRDWSRPWLHGTPIHRSLVSEGSVGDIRHDVPMLGHTHARLAYDATNGHCVQSPFFEDAEDFVLTSSLGDQQHAFLGLAEHDLVRSHSGLALGNLIQLDLD